MRVKDIIPYIDSKIITISYCGYEECRILRSGNKTIYQPEPTSYHEIADCKVDYITSSVTGIRIEILF